MKTIAIAAAFLVAASGAAAQPMIGVIDSTADRIMLYNATDGSLVNADWFYLLVEPQTPKAIVDVGDEIWVNDQLRDKISRISKDLTNPQLLGEIVGGLDNMRGMAKVGNKVYVANAGSNNGAPGESVIIIDIATATIESSFPVTDPFDVVALPSGNILVNDIDNDAVHEYTAAGVFVGTVIDSDGINSFDFPQQMALRANGDLLINGFTSPTGIFNYSEGLLTNSWLSTDAGRGVIELGNGNILFTGGSNGGVFVLDPNTGSMTPVGPASTGVSGQYAGLIDFGGGGGCPVCAADYDQSGGVDGDDITAFFNDWQAGAPCGDVDGSGGVDGDDIPFFFERWQAGGCN